MMAAVVLLSIDQLANRATPSRAISEVANTIRPLPLSPQRIPMVSSDSTTQAVLMTTAV